MAKLWYGMVRFNHCASVMWVPGEDILAALMLWGVVTGAQLDGVRLVEDLVLPWTR